MYLHTLLKGCFSTISIKFFFLYSFMGKLMINLLIYIEYVTKFNIFVNFFFYLTLFKFLRFYYVYLFVPFVRPTVVGSP